MIVHPELSKAIHYISSSGEKVKWSHLMKFVYAHILNKNWFFTVKLGCTHFESQKTMAEAVGSDYQVVGRILRSFRDNGIIDFKTESIKGSVQKRCVYTRVSSVLTLVDCHDTVYTVDLMKHVKNESPSEPIDFDSYYNIQFEERT